MSESISRKRPREKDEKGDSIPHHQATKRRKQTNWGKTSRTWEESFSALVAYKEANGDCNVPAKFQEDRSLGQWVEKTRRDAVPNVSQQQRERLTQLGFNWETLEQRNEREWNERYERLKQYWESHGNCLIPSSTKVDWLIPWVEELGIWVSTQRQFYKKRRLLPDRQQKLEKLGFVWSLNKKHKKIPDTTKRDKQWQKQYNKLIGFLNEHGHTLVTATSKDKALFNWVKCQRENYARKQIRLDREELLNEIDFVWKTEDNGPNAQESHNQMKWDHMCELLQEYKQEYGHLRVPRELLPLGNWLDHQKTYWRRNQLDDYRVQKLVSIGVLPVRLKKYSAKTQRKTQQRVEC